MNTQEVKHWTQGIEIVRIMYKMIIIKGEENEHWDYGRIKS